LSKRLGFCLSLLAVLALAGCGGDDDDGDNDNDRAKPPPAAAGTFVGKLSDSDAFVAVVAAPPAKGEKEREVTAFVCDGERLCTWYSGSTSGNRFVAESSEGEARGTLSRKAATGTVELTDGETARYNAGEAAAASGLYDLTVSAAGKLRGASAAGVALKGEVALPPPGSGAIRLADGTRLKFDVTKNTAGDAADLRAGQVRLIVLPDGQLRGAGMSRDGDQDFLVSSTAE
jgi:hypothetical protein